VDVISQVESTAKVVNTPTQDSSSNANSDDEDMLPITVRTLIVNEEPDFNTQGKKTTVKKHLALFTLAICQYIAMA